jgi:hypothetical protein
MMNTLHAIPFGIVAMRRLPPPTPVQRACPVALV